MTPGEWIPAFFYLLERTGDIQLSAERAGVTRQAVYRRKDRDHQFRERLKAVCSARAAARVEKVRKTH